MDREVSENATFLLCHRTFLPPPSAQLSCANFKLFAQKYTQLSIWKYHCDLWVNTASKRSELTSVQRLLYKSANWFPSKKLQYGRSARTQRSTDWPKSPFHRRSANIRERCYRLQLLHDDDDVDDDGEGGYWGTDIRFLKHDSNILRQSSIPVCGFSTMEQVRLCDVWPTENWLGSSMNHIQGRMTVWECYCHAL